MISNNLSSTNDSFIYEIERFVDISVKLNSENEVITEIDLKKDVLKNKMFLNVILDKLSSYEDSKLRLEAILRDCKTLLGLIDKELGIEGGLATDPKSRWN